MSYRRLSNPFLSVTLVVMQNSRRRDKGKWIKESGPPLLASPRHDSGSGGKCLGSSAGRPGEESP